MAEITKILGQEKTIAKIDRLIKLGKRGQALLITGSPGIGKFALAQYIVRRFLCSDNNSGCGKCFSCRSINNQNHPDFLLVFPFPNIASESKKNPVFHFSDPTTGGARFSDEALDEANRFRNEKLADPYRQVTFKRKGNIPVSVIKDLKKTVGKKPMLGKRRAIVICDIDQMAFGAADLFLKTVEEPPEDSLIILTTSKPQLLLPTLVSRTTRFALAPVSDDLIRNYLIEHGVKKAVDFYISFSSGSPGLALKAFEDETISRRDLLWKLLSDFITSSPLPKTIESLHRRYRWPNFDEVRYDFEIMEKILHDIYIAKLGLDNSIINIDIKDKIIECAQSGPSVEILRKWFPALVKASKAHGTNNVSADIAFIGAFIEFNRTRRFD
ncbi:MAG: hypothetical protein J7K40_07335 [candidate division Zixibacteria bacterium]|nr:hypothetical protein [candidate division Zixibacteria bacterium]